MKTNFTPKPWKVAKWPDSQMSDGFQTVIVDSRGHGIAVFNQKGKSKKVEANARLIAASPELLDALNACRSALAKEQLRRRAAGFKVPEDITNAYGAACAAIAKALEKG